MAQEGIILRELKEGTDSSDNYSTQKKKKGDKVYRFSGVIYGCISEEGVAVTDNIEGGFPFYEIPKNAVSWKE